MKKLYTISELSKILNLIHPNKKTQNHTLRYWEKEFKQIRPKKINNRRYYSLDQVEAAKLIKFLLKSKGMSITGVKNVFKSNINKLDDYNSDSLKADYYIKNFKEKSINLLKKIKNLKKYGKKNSLKS